MTAARSDPLGRVALFRLPGPAATGNGSGKHSLYSRSRAIPARPVRSPWGTFVVDCSACGARCGLSPAELVARHLPFWLWVPWQRYTNFMSCPACEERTWVGVSWTL